MDTKGLQQEFINWCKSNNKSPKSEDETKQLFITFMKLKHPEEYKRITQNQQKQQQAQAKKAAHGTKLTYFKSLKNQCAEDEEVTYFKKGGSVRCGCKKKEDGGEIAKALNGTAVDKFKNRKKEVKQDLATRDSIRINSAKGDDELEANRPGSYKPNPKHNPKDPKSRTHIWVPDRTKEPYNKKDKVKKDCGGSAIKKFKMHRQGGSLNGIPFMQNGTYRGGVQYRFRRTTNDMNNGYKTYSDLIMMTQDPLGRPTYDTPPIPAGRTIYVTPLGNDTIFYTNNDIFNETPKGDLNLKKAKLKFYQLIKKAPIEGEQYRMTPYWNSNHINLDMVRNRALKGN